MFVLKFPVRIPPPRRAERTWLPAALAALLGLVLVMQLALPSTVDLPDAGLVRPLRPLRLPQLAFGATVVDPAVSARPLFAPGRRENADAVVAARQAPLEGARAVGVIMVRSNARVFLQAPDGKVTPVGPGGSYRGWRLVRIRPDQLLFARGAETAAIALTASAPPVAAAATETPEEEPQ